MEDKEKKSQEDMVKEAVEEAKKEAEQFLAHCGKLKKMKQKKPRQKKFLKNRKQGQRIRQKKKLQKNSSARRIRKTKRTRRLKN